MKLTFALAMVAQAMLETDRNGDGRLWGYALSKQSGVRSGVLYPQLDRMLEQGWVEDSWESVKEAHKRPPRRFYTLTDEGRAQLGAVVRRAASEPRFASVPTARWA